MFGISGGPVGGGGGYFLHRDGVTNKLVLRNITISIEFIDFLLLNLLTKTYEFFQKIKQFSSFFPCFSVL